MSIPGLYHDLRTSSASESKQLNDMTTKGVQLDASDQAELAKLQAELARVQQRHAAVTKLISEKKKALSQCQSEKAYSSSMGAPVQSESAYTHLVRNKPLEVANLAQIKRASSKETQDVSRKSAAITKELGDRIAQAGRVVAETKRLSDDSEKVAKDLVVTEGLLASCRK